MAVFTHVTHSQVQDFCDQYEGIGKVVSVSPITAGTDNSNYLVKTETEHYILTLFEGRIPDTDLPPIFDFIDHINTHAISSPTAYVAKNGQMLQSLAGKSAALIHFVSGKSVDTPNANHCFQIGTVLANMHNAAENFTGQLQKNPLSISKWTDIYQQCLDTLNTDDRTYANHILQKLQDQWPQDKNTLPYGAVHLDAFPDNIFFENDTLSSVIDFYFAAQDFYAYDLVLTLNAWAFDDTGSAIKENLTAFLKGYHTRRSVTEDEKNMLSLFGMGAAFRIFVTRLRDTGLKDNTDIVYTAKDPMPYLNIIKFYEGNGLTPYLS